MKRRIIGALIGGLLGVSVVALNRGDVWSLVLGFLFGAWIVEMFPTQWDFEWSFDGFFEGFFSWPWW